MSDEIYIDPRTGEHVSIDEYIDIMIEIQNEDNDDIIVLKLN